MKILDGLARKCCLRSEVWDEANVPQLLVYKYKGNIGEGNSIQPM